MIGSFITAAADNPDLTCVWINSDANRYKAGTIIRSAGLTWPKNLKFIQWKPTKTVELNSLTLDKTIRKAKKHLGGRLDVAVLDSVADVLMHCTDAFMDGDDTSWNEASQQHVSKATAWLLRLAEEHQVALELIAHPSKSHPSSLPFHGSFPHRFDIVRMCYSKDQVTAGRHSPVSKPFLTAMVNSPLDFFMHVQRSRITSVSEGRYGLKFVQGIVHQVPLTVKTPTVTPDASWVSSAPDVDYKQRIIEHLQRELPHRHAKLPVNKNQLLNEVKGHRTHLNRALTELMASTDDGDYPPVRLGACCTVYTCLHVCEKVT